MQAHRLGDCRGGAVQKRLASEDSGAVPACGDGERPVRTTELPGRVVDHMWPVAPERIAARVPRDPHIVEFCSRVSSRAEAMAV